MMENQPERIEQLFQEGVDLAQRGRRAQALRVFESCLALAAEQRAVLAVDEYAAMLQEIAWCHGDMGNWDEARLLYEQIERLLTQAPGWREVPPVGIELVVPEGYSPAPRLAALYESLGIGYDNAGDLQQAMRYYRRAIAGYTALDNRPKAATVWHHVALGCQRRQDWQGLQNAAERMLELWSAVSGEYGQVWALQYLAQAHANQGDLLAGLRALEQAVAIERRLQHRDLARDERLLEELRRAYQRTPLGFLRRLLRRD